MSDQTGIEWADSTWNPVTGCTKVSQGCKFCYAKHQAWPRLTAMPNTVYTGREFEQVMCHPERLDQPLRWSKPRMIFVNSMSDLFHEDVPDEFLSEVFAVMAMAKRHVFQVLTKRPDRMLDVMSDPIFYEAVLGEVKASSKFIDFVSMEWPLPNVWLGVSVEDQAAADERIPLLLQTPAAVRWISAEPLLGPVDLPGLFYYGTEKTGGVVPLRDRGHTQLDWVVVGGESGPNARPMHPELARSLRDQCAAAGVPFMFKQWGEWATDDVDDETVPIRDYAGVLPNGDAALMSAGYLIPWDGGAALKARGNVRIDGRTLMCRVGKKAAGRLLDGVQHDGYPKCGVKPC